MNKIAAVMLVVVAAAAFGCNKSQTHETPGGKVTVASEGDTAKLEITTKDGKATMIAGDAGVAVPSTFPRDVPIPKGAVPKLTMSQGPTELLHLQVQGSVADVAKEYQEKLKGEGWEIESSANMGEASTIQAKKDNRTCAVMVVKDGEAALVQLSVTRK